MSRMNYQILLMFCLEITITITLASIFIVWVNLYGLEYWYMDYSEHESWLTLFLAWNLISTNQVKHKDRKSVV